MKVKKEEASSTFHIHAHISFGYIYILSTVNYTCTYIFWFYIYIYNIYYNWIIWNDPWECQKLRAAFINMFFFFPLSICCPALFARSIQPMCLSTLIPSLSFSLTSFLNRNSYTIVIMNSVLTTKYYIIYTSNIGIIMSYVLR